MFSWYFYESAEVQKKFIDENTDLLQRICELIVHALKNGNKILVCWNGGSAADSQHFVAELIARYKTERKSLPAIALTTDTSILTAIGNDYDFDRIFSRQVEWLWQKWDILIWFSTSGNSKNIVRAIEIAKSNGMISIGLLGKGGWCIKDIVDYAIIVPSDNTPRIQECHMTIYHSICEYIDASYTAT